MKKLLALLLAVCMVMSFAACGGETADETADTTAAAEGETTAAGEQEPLDKITIWSNSFYNSTEAKDAFCAQFEKDTGVKLEWVGFPKEDYEDVILASIMSCEEDELPDIVYNAPLGVMLRQELLYDMSGLIENNEAISGLIERNPAVIEQGLAGDGIYALSSCNFQSMIMWTRQDLVDELKIENPKNLDEFTALLRTIKEAHPEMIPLTGAQNMTTWDAVSGWFGVHNDIRKNAEGVYVDDTLTPEYKEYMDYMAMLYKEGLVDKELPTNASYGDVRTRFVSGSAAITLMWDNLYDFFNKGFKGNGIETEPIYLPPFDGDNGTFGVMYNPPQNPYMMTIGVDEAKAQQIFDTFFPWLLTSEQGVVQSMFGPEGYEWENVDGVFEVRATDVGVKAQSTPAMDPDFQFPFEFDEIQSHRFTIINAIREELTARADTVMRPVPGAEFVEYNGIQSDLKAKRTELYYLYITGQSDYESFADEYQNYCDEVGLQAMLDAMNAK